MNQPNRHAISLWSLVVAAILAGGFVGACSGSSDDADARMEEASQGEPEVEGGVPVLVAGPGTELDGFVPTVGRHPDEVDAGTIAILASAEQPSAPIAVWEVQPEFDVADVEDNTLLSDGKPAMFKENPFTNSLTWRGDGNEFMFLQSRTLGERELLEIADGGIVDDGDLTSTADEWPVVGAVPLPVYVDGYSVSYDLEPPFIRSVFITTTKRRGDRMLLAEYGPTEPAEIEGFADARRFIPELGTLPGYILERDDLVIEVTGDLTDEEFLEVIASLRPAKPDEFEIEEPDT